jgi:hypothetical protein
MSIRPKDLKNGSAPRFALHCGECVADYSASADAYVWMQDDAPIVCEACGIELILEETTIVD